MGRVLDHPGATGARTTYQIRMAIDNNLTDVGQQLGGAVLSGRQLKQLRRLIDEAGGELPGSEFRVVHQVDEEGNVCFHTAHAEFLQRALHTADGIDEAQAVSGYLDEQG